MEREALLAQLKAFQTYLKNYIEDVKSRPQIELDEDGELPVDAHNANFTEKEHINHRYSKLKLSLEQEYSDFFTEIS